MSAVTDHGINLEAIHELQRKLQLTNQDVAAIVGVDPSTLWRWKTGTSPRGIVRSRIVQLGELGELLRRLFDGPDLAREWLKDARPEMLGGQRTPLEVMREGRIDRVLMVLHFLARGA